jgi:hypothetical protein
MTAKKPMGTFWAILEVRDDLLSGGLRILLGRMYLLDNGTRGCTASAAPLGSYTGLTPRTVDDYRRHLEQLGLAYRISGSRGWHVVLPPGQPGDRAGDDEIRTYAQRIEDAIAKPRPQSEQTPIERERNPDPGREIQHPEIPTVVGESVGAQVSTTGSAVARGLMSTHEKDTALMSSSRSRTEGTHEPPPPPTVDPETRAVIDKLNRKRAAIAATRGAEPAKLGDVIKGDTT